MAIYKETQVTVDPKLYVAYQEPDTVRVTLPNGEEVITDIASVQFTQAEVDALEASRPSKYNIIQA